MSGFDSFLGNERLKARLIRDIGSKHLSHAYIIEGAAGSGKRTLAKLICAAVSCHSEAPPCMECLSCDKIMRGQSPDVITVEADRDRVQLGVDVIRRLRSDAVFAANDLDNKFYIFPEADTMNPQAQNALLKLLEEPPEGIMFLLLCQNADNLLPTIRSRAPSCRLEPLGDDMIEHWLLENDPEAIKLHQSDPDAFRAAVKLAGGSLGRARELCEPKSASEALRLWNAAERFVSLLSARGAAANELAFYEYATKLASPKQRSELIEIYQLLADAVRDLVAAKLTHDFRPLFYFDSDTAREISGKFPLSQLMRLSDSIAEALDGLDRNINIGLAQTRLAMSAVSAQSKNR